MFGGFGGFDPFQNMNSMMRRQMQDMEDLMESMVDPFGVMGGSYAGGSRRRNPRQEMIEDNVMENPRASRGGERSLSNRHQNPFHDDMAMMPFGGFFGGGVFGQLNNMMRHMEHRALSDPNAHIYSQSTVIGMAPGADGRMQYYESNDTVRKAGDVKEVRKSVRDTSKGVEKMTIGHHIGDRAHIIEKKRDKSGQIVEDQKYVGIKEDDARHFDREWSSATQQALNPNRYRLPDQRYRPGNLSIEEGPGRSDRRERHNSPYARASDRKKPRGPIIEEVE